MINPPLTISQGFSPNGDGLNDILHFGGLANYPGSSVLIFSREGRIVFESKDDPIQWDGKYQKSGSESRIAVNSGVYYYILKLGGTNRVLKGFIYVGY